MPSSTEPPLQDELDVLRRKVAVLEAEAVRTHALLAEAGTGAAVSNTTQDAVHRMALAAAEMRRATNPPMSEAGADQPQAGAGGADRAAVTQVSAGRAHNMAAGRAELASLDAANDALSRANGELARSQAALRRSEERLRALSETIPQLVWTSHADGHWDWSGPQWQAYTGRSEAGSLRHGWLAMVHPDDRARTLTAWREATALGCSGGLDVEHRLRRAEDGAWRWFQTRAVPLPAHEAGDEGADGLRWFGTCTDVDDLKQAEERLQRLNEMLEAEIAQRTRERDRTWQLSQELLVVMQLDGTLVAVNPAWTRLLGYAERDLVGTTALALVHPDDQAALLAEQGHLARGLHVSRLENRYRHHDGSWRWLCWTAAADAGLIYATGRDITAEHEAAVELERVQEQLRQAQTMEAVGQLTGGIAHDVNNMLQSIGGSLDLMQRRVEQGRAGEVGRYVDVARGSVERAAALTHRLLAFARRQALDPRPVDLDMLITGMAERVRRTVGPDIHVEVDLHDGTWPVLCDVHQLESALLNLATNARDAMPEGGRFTVITAHVALGPGDVADQEGARPGSYVEITVADTGTGMTPNVLARAFEPFFTTKLIGQGTGLGLSQAYGFVRQSGGVARLESTPGQGTRVRLYLPRHEQTSPPTAARGATETERVSAKMVLLVEDDADVRELVAESLRELGYGILEAKDGTAALRVLWSATHVDLLVTDVGLPGLNGRQVADAARERRPDLPVLFITGYAGGAVAGALPAGMAVLGKPFALGTLAERVTALLAG